MLVSKKSRFTQGYYTPKHPEKYTGDIHKIRYMSSWELQAHNFFDNNPRVLRWSSEGFCIPYIKPTDGKIHKYYPDYWIEYINTNGEIIQEVIEIKPKTQTKPPRSNSKYRLYEQLTFAVNTAKWRACSIWCQQRNMSFRLLTEMSVFK